MSSMNEWSPSQIPSLEGKVFFITGGTSGLGAGSIQLLAAKNPAHIYFSGRREKNAQEIISKVKQQNPAQNITFIRCDQADLSSCTAAAREFLSKSDRLDVFYGNAGIMACEPGLTKDGYEIQFGTNHLGHAVLLKHLLPLMRATAALPDADVRIINMSSVGYKQAPKEGIAFSTIKTNQDGLGGIIPGGRWTRYGQSKLANMLYARELARKYPEIKCVSVHPGYIKTDLFANVPASTLLPVRLAVPFQGGWTPVEKGSYNQTWAGTTDRSNLRDGAYYVPIAKQGQLETARSRDDQLAERLWEWTQKEIAGF